MKKILLTAVAILIALTASACMNRTAKKAIEEYKLAMANSDYVAALNYIRLAEKEGGGNSETHEVASILENYLKAKDELDNNNIEAASDSLDAIPESYTNYSIANDVDALKETVSVKSEEIEDIDAQIANVKSLVANGSYDLAYSYINDLYTKDLNNFQKKQVDELKDTIDSANSKIKEAENKKPEVVYVPTSSNTTVVATYYVVNCKEFITLRSAPSTSASEITKIPLGSAVGYIENAGNGFYKIQYNGNVGYSLASYLSASNPKKDPVASQTAQVVNCKEWITLRATPSTNAASLAHIPLGAYVTYIDTAENGFCCVEYNGQRGYALQSYLVLR